MASTSRIEEVVEETTNLLDRLTTPSLEERRTHEEHLKEKRDKQRAARKAKRIAAAIARHGATQLLDNDDFHIERKCPSWCPHAKTQDCDYLRGDFLHPLDRKSVV